MRELDAGPSAVGLKVSVTNVNGGRVIGRSARIDDTDQGCLLRSIVERVILGVATDANIRLVSLKSPEVVALVLLLLFLDLLSQT